RRPKAECLKVGSMNLRKLSSVIKPDFFIRLCLMPERRWRTLGLQSEMFTDPLYLMGRVNNDLILISEPHFGQSKGSTSKTSSIHRAQD
ncbi:MAG: hypothetical protein KDD69_10265, partial [Bdellovibrionales bacterium]|nr:hypothetical protein [Bdellovibrionales bacterium]